ncbi:MAG: acyltransferase family protein [Bacteroidota bacterium]
MRIEQLTFTRFLAAIPIVLFHYSREIFPFNTPALNFLVVNANMGVSYFFILSGFVMAIAYGNRQSIDFGDFVKRRFARIYPVHFLAIILLLVCFVARNSPCSDYRGLLLNLTLLQSWVPGFALSFNVPAWSLSTEMFFYLSFPFIFNRLYRIEGNRKYLIYTTIFFFIIAQILLHIAIKPTPLGEASTQFLGFAMYSPITHINEFLIGNIAGFFFVEKKIKTRNYDLPIIGLLVLLILTFKYNTFFILHNGLLAFIFVPFILLLSANNGFITKFANMKIPVFLGEISYSIYILQFAIVTLWGENSVRTNATFFYPYLISLIIVAALSFKYIETPLRTIITKTDIKQLFSRKKIK